MENKNLIPLSDFVLEQERILKEVYANFTDPEELDEARLEFFVRVTNYTRFLKQPLKLNMFVPVDDNGNIFKEPHLGMFHDNRTPLQDLNIAKIAYEKALEKVLFEGFDVSVNKITNGVNDVYYMGSDGKYRKHCLMGDNVEYLVYWDLTLTPSGLNKIRIKE